MAGYKNFQVNRNKAHKSVNIFDKSNITRKEKDKSTRLMEGVAIWTSFYRANPHRFVKECLGINLRLFQQIILWAMMHFNYLTYIASRGQGKTYLTAIYCVTRAILYPESKIVVAAGVKSQAREIITKIEEIIVNSPFLEREIKDIKPSVNEGKVLFHNGSYIRTVASNDNARGSRAHVLIVDEFRMVDLDVINTVLKKFKSAQRQPKYLEKEEYKHLREKNKEIFLSSAYYKSHHTYDRVESYLNSYLNDKPYFVCSMPYQIAIKEGLLDKDEVENEMQEATFNEISWLMEMESLFYGQSTKSIFKFEDMLKARKLERTFYTKDVTSMLGNDKSLKTPDKDKVNGEVRVISADIAVKAGSQNDATAITIARLIPKKNGYDREIVYLETLEGVHTGQQALRLKQLFKEFECDYIVLDTSGVGIGVYDALTLKVQDRGIDYDALTCMNDVDLAKRCMYPNAPKVIFAIHATAELNSDIAFSFKDALEKGKIILPVIESEGKDFLNTIEKYKKLPLEQRMEFLQCYIHTDLLINEVINLEAEINEIGRIKLREPRSGRKDRYTSISYLNYFADYLDVKNRKREQKKFDPTKLFMARKPKLY